MADGIRALAAAAPESVQPAWPLPTVGVARLPWRRALLMVGTTAAAIVLLGGIGAVTGIVHVHLSTGTSNGRSSPSVTGCSQLEQANGHLSRSTTTAFDHQTDRRPPGDRGHDELHPVNMSGRF